MAVLVLSKALSYRSGLQALSKWQTQHSSAYCRGGDFKSGALCALQVACRDHQKQLHSHIWASRMAVFSMQPMQTIVVVCSLCRQHVCCVSRQSEPCLRLNSRSCYGRCQTPAASALASSAQGANTRTHHIPNLQRIPGVELVAVANRSLESSARVAEEFGIPRIAASWRDIVEDDDVDAVVIGTWPYLHAPISVTALDKGKHVLTEARMVRRPSLNSQNG